MIFSKLFEQRVKRQLAEVVRARQRKAHAVRRLSDVTKLTGMPIEEVRLNGSFTGQPEAKF